MSSKYGENNLYYASILWCFTYHEISVRNKALSNLTMLITEQWLLQIQGLASNTDLIFLHYTLQGITSLLSWVTGIHISKICTYLYKGFGGFLHWVILLASIGKVSDVKSQWKLCRYISYTYLKISDRQALGETCLCVLTYTYQLN